MGDSARAGTDATWVPGWVVARWCTIRGMIRLPGYVAREHVVTVPLDHGAAEGATIDVFARELVDPGKQDDDLPYLLFLQGGPGGKSPRPLDRSAWIDQLAREDVDRGALSCTVVK